MTAYSHVFALSAWLGSEIANYFELALPIHDKGEIETLDNFLNAPRKLEANEWEIMKDHAMIG